ncbi:hypothetical protein PODOV027v1_10002 [Vibrio phage PS35B.3]|nr:hypothetical protein PODOV027v1_10002 [Vibrio phage PS35B.3]
MDAGLFTVWTGNLAYSEQTDNAPSCSPEESHGSYMGSVDHYTPSGCYDVIRLCYSRISGNTAVRD